eukprot:gene24696-biopygen10180
MFKNAPRGGLLEHTPPPPPPPREDCMPQLSVGSRPPGNLVISSRALARPRQMYTPETFRQPFGTLCPSLTELHAVEEVTKSDFC